MGGGISIKLPLNHPRHFEIHHVLGKGGFAIVYEATHRTNKKIVAVKQTYFPNPANNENEINMTLTELDALKQTGHHPFVIKLHSAFREYSSCYLVLDLLVGGDIRYQLRNFQLFQEHHVAYFISCIGLALHHLHQRGIYHRDVKPENILLGHTGRPYLSDFGTAYVIFDQNSLPICTYSSGTLPYLAPEVLTSSRRHAYQADFWSLGILAYELLFHCRPFDSHCCKEYIYYVDNEYHLVWDYLTHAHQQSVSQRQAAAAAAAAAAVTTISLSEENAVVVETTFTGYLHDFNAVYSSISPEIIREYLPYPQHYPVPPPTPINEESLPPQQQQQQQQQHQRLNQDLLDETLLVPIPTHTYCGDLVSPECISFIKSLLDIRIHKRLGQLNQFQEFIQHDWLHSYGYTSLERLDTCRPAFQPNVEEIQSILKSRYSEATKQIKLNYQREVVAELRRRSGGGGHGGGGGGEMTQDSRDIRGNETIPNENEENPGEVSHAEESIPLHIELKLQKYSFNPPGPVPSLLGFQSHNFSSLPALEMKPSPPSPGPSSDVSVSIAS